MPQSLSERAEELVRQHLIDAIRPTEIHGYDPRQTNRSETDYLPVSCDWSNRGDHYPIIIVQENSGPQIPNSGNTGFNGQMGDGSGPTQYTIKNVTVSCQTLEGGAYLGGVNYDDLVKALYDECHHQFQNNTETAVSEALFAGMTPPTYSRNTEETDSGSTITWMQAQGTVNVGVLDTP